MTGLDTGGALAAWRKEYGQGLREPTPATAALLRQRAAKDPPGLLAIQFEALALTGQWEPPYDGGTPVPNLLVLAKRGEPAAIAFLCRTAGLPFILMRNHAPFCAKGVALGQPESAYHLARLHHGRADDFHDGFIDKIDEALHIKPSLPRALALYRQAAQGGHAGAQARLATLLAAGRGVKPDPVQARELAERSAEAGWPEGKAVLGILLLKGQGGPADIGRALMLLDQAARSGQRMAQFTLATLAFRGQYRPRDFLDALTWVRLAQLSRRGDPPEAATERKAAADGDPSALIAQAWYHPSPEAFLSELSAAGHAMAHTILANREWLKEGRQGSQEPSPETAKKLREATTDTTQLRVATQSVTGRWEPAEVTGSSMTDHLVDLANKRDPTAIAFACRNAGLPWLLSWDLAPFCVKGVALGQADSAYHLARLQHARADDFQQGLERRVPKVLGIPTSLPRAVTLYRQAAQGGHAGAQARLATLLAAGRGVKPDPVQARELAERSAGAGWPEGQAVLGILLLKGQGGPADIGRALTLLDQAARSGQRMAQFTLATLAFRGQHRTRDFLDALTWLHLSELSAHGDPPEAEADGLLLEPLRRTRHVARSIENPALDLDARIKATALRKELHESGQWPLTKTPR
ncbi:tetratricopeptide repeat protein [Magnetospirillum moscoviense]|nr:tetratricopeptide repeat protein [Magnetospirillum moscoviense]